VLFDFGGVLTSSVVACFRAFGARYGDPDLPLRLLRKGERAGALFVAAEEGRISYAEFEAGFAEELARHGVVVEADGLIARVHGNLRPDPETIELVAVLRAEGRPIGLLSNSFGDDCYAGFDLGAMFDAVTISGEIGVRKPSRRAYRIGCSRLGVMPEETVMVDDLEQNITGAARLGMAGVVHRDASSTRAALTALLVEAGPLGC
jgi:putative hydrolase of the HAD superfamily